MAKETFDFSQDSKLNSGSSYVTGFIGATLGALVGILPWFLASTFTGFFVGWLGFIVAFCSFFGYKLFKGAKNYVYAFAVIIVLSILAIVISEFSSNMYMLMTDPEWQQAAVDESISLFSLCFFSLIMPENLPLILPNLAIGLVIGVLGIFSVKNNIKNYVCPPVEKPVDEYALNESELSEDDDSTEQATAE